MLSQQTKSSTSPPDQSSTVDPNLLLTDTPVTTLQANSDLFQYLEPFTAQTNDPFAFFTSDAFAGATDDGYTNWVRIECPTVAFSDVVWRWTQPTWAFSLHVLG